MSARHPALALASLALTLVVVAAGHAAGKLLEPGSLLDTKIDADLYKKIAEGLGKIDDANTKKDDYIKDLDELSKSDKKYDPNYELPGSPQLPSLCIGSRQCEACFKPAYEELNETRFRFEKLRKVNKVTKTMLRDSLSFGDAAASAAGGLAPLAWQKEKEKIRASEKSFNASYDAKYEELIKTLHNNLLDISECEEKIFGAEDWYDRYGFVYHSFMATAYRRPD
jgi:hypothetical protein